MSGYVLRYVPTLGTAVVLLAVETASAQLFPFFNQCNTCAPQPVQCNPCQTVQPIAQTCYRTVPVTEYRQVREKVRRPVVETKYVDQQVTEYRPVTEQRTVNVPHTRMQTVTECREVQRDAGRWVTNYHCVPKVSPCQYDNRPTLTGFLNRSAYSFRSAFTPNYSTSRQYVPNVVTQQVPITYNVPVQETQQVTYNVTKMVPYTTTKKVAVNTVRYVEEEVVAMKPITVMRTVPIGTSLSYAVTPYGSSTQTALRPTPDPVSAAPRDDSRTADSRNDKNRDAFENNSSDGQRIKARGSSLSRPLDESRNDSEYRSDSRAQTVPSPAPAHVAQKTFRTPSVVQVSAWKATRSHIRNAGPELVAPAVAVADVR